MWGQTGVIKLFSSTDRATRINLLKQVRACVRVRAGARVSGCASMLGYVVGDMLARLITGTVGL